MSNTYPVGTCAHCSRRGHLRPRGLCAVCYAKPAVRYAYPTSEHPNAHQGAGLGFANHPAPDAPTYTSPGTHARLAVLAARAQAGLALHHPGDETRLDGVTAAELLADPGRGVPETGRRIPKPKSRPAADRPAVPRCSQCKRPRVTPSDGFKMCPKCRAMFLARYHARKAILARA